MASVSVPPDTFALEAALDNVQQRGDLENFPRFFKMDHDGSSLAVSSASSPKTVVPSAAEQSGVGA